MNAVVALEWAEYFHEELLTVEMNKDFIEETINTGLAERHTKEIAAKDAGDSLEGAIFAVKKSK